MDHYSVYSKVIAVSIILIVSYFFNLASKKYKIPDVLLLIGLGIGVREFLDSFKVDFSPYINIALQLLIIVGLIMIVLEATLDLKLKRDKKQILIKSLFIAILYFIITSTAIAYLMYTFLIEDFTIAVIYAIPFSILSSSTVLPSLTKLSETKKDILIFESTFSVILGIMIFYLLIENINTQTKEISLTLSGNIILTIVASVVLSYGLVLLLKYLDAKVKLLFLIAILVLLYSIGKIFHLSSLLIILVFGLILSNHALFFRGKLKDWINKDSINRILNDFRILTLESTFVVRTLFFVLFGMSINLSTIGDLTSILIGGGILILAYLIRMILLKMILRKHIYPQVWIAPRDLITVLLFFSIPLELRYVNFNPTILMIVIIGSGIIMSGSLMARQEDFEETDILSFNDWDELDDELEKLNAESEKSRLKK